MQIDESEINGRFAALEEQRNQALNSYVLLRGELAKTQTRVAELEKELEALKAESESEAAAKLAADTA